VINCSFWQQAWPQPGVRIDREVALTNHAIALERHLAGMRMQGRETFAWRDQGSRGPNGCFVSAQLHKAALRAERRTGVNSWRSFVLVECLASKRLGASHCAANA
jgi:hypothetical protein